ARYFSVCWYCRVYCFYSAIMLQLPRYKLRVESRDSALMPTGMSATKKQTLHSLIITKGKYESNRKTTTRSSVRCDNHGRFRCYLGQGRQGRTHRATSERRNCCA